MVSKGHRPHRAREAVGFPEVPPEDRILAELPRLERAIRLLQERERVREHNHPAERNPQRAAERAIIEAEIATRFELERNRPITERVGEYVILTDDEGNYAGLERSAPQR